MEKFTEKDMQELLEYRMCKQAIENYQICMKTHPHSEEFQKAAKIVIESMHPDCNLRIADYLRKFPYEFKITNNPEFDEYFVAHEQAILKSGNAEYNFRFAKEFSRSNVTAHADVVLKSGDIEYNYKFAEFFSPPYTNNWAYWRLHSDVVLKSGDVKYNCFLAVDGLSSHPIRKHADVVLNSRSAEYNFICAKRFHKHAAALRLGVDFRNHARVVLKSKEEKWIKLLEENLGMMQIGFVRASEGKGFLGTLRNIFKSNDKKEVL